MTKTERYSIYILRLFIYICVLSLITGCASSFLSKFDTSKPIYDTSASKDFKKDIARFNEETKDHHDISVRSRAHFVLAALHSHHNNSSPDYLTALKELRSYISLDPDSAERDDIRNWLAVLLKLEKITKKAGGNEKRLIFLSRENSKLSEENKKLKETIEKLKSLDIRLEQRRREVK